MPRRQSSVPDLPVYLLYGRLALATTFLIAPEAGLRAFGVDTGTARRVTWLTRMMAIRDAALAAGGLAAHRRNADAQAWLLGGAASDLVDGIVIGAAVRQGRLRGIRPALVAPGGVVAAALGVAAAQGVAAARR